MLLILCSVKYNAFLAKLGGLKELDAKYEAGA
jgi:hypothetical protein